MADEEDIDVSKPKEPPKPVHIGGESLADKIIPHLKKIVVSIIVVAVILSVFFGIRAWKQSKQAESTEKLAKVMQVAQRPVAAPGMPPEELAKLKDAFADDKARAIAVLDEAAKTGADLAHSYRGGLLLDAGRVDDAIAEYRKGTSKSGIEGVLSREGLGIALETKGIAEKDTAARQKLFEEALATFTSMQPAKDGFRRGYALYHQARILDHWLNKKAEAKALYEQAKEVGTPSVDLLVLIEKRLAALGAT